jgi:hypothetical protein
MQEKMQVKGKIQPGKKKEGSDPDQEEKVGAKAIEPGRAREGSDPDEEEKVGSKDVEDDG